MFALAETELTGLEELVRRLEGDARVKLRRVAEFIGERTVEYLKSYTSEIRPPTTPGGPTGPAHPGHWKDITKQLVEGYGSRVTEDVDGLTLEVFNRSDHAIFVEMRQGYFVLHSVMDPGGPVEQALRKAVAQIAPEWTVFTRG
jgi:hypothetical protein